MRKSIFILFLLSYSFCFSQKEASNWFFGENAGLSFNLDANTVTPVNVGRLNTREGCSSISDDNGNLLFYTDGTTVFNKNHQVMLNGDGLLGDESSTQSAIVVPKPGDPNIYYVFTVGSNQTKSGLNYSVIDITLDGGLGSVIEKNINLLNSCSEKITAVLKDCFSKDIWVVTFAPEDGFSEIFDTFYAYQVSALGVNSTPVKSKFNLNVTDARGYLKLSPDGTKVACANIEDGLYIYDFEVSTGEVLFEKRLFINSNNGGIHPYGVEFSPNSQFLYVNSYNNYRDTNNSNNRNDPSFHKSTLTQFDVTNPNVQSTEVTLDDRQLYRGGLQLGPDGKIYRALNATYDIGLPSLGVINVPNTAGISCNYRHNAINLSPNNSSQGLPPFIASFFNTEIDLIKNGESSSNLVLCEGQTYTLTSVEIPGATYNWTVNNSPLPNNTFNLKVSNSGNYKLNIIPNNGDCIIEGQAFVIVNPKPVASNHTIMQCDEDGLKDGKTLFNLNEAHNALTNNTPNRTSKFYTDLGRTIEINAAAFRNTTNPQTIYTKIINNETGCINTSILTLEVSNTDANNTSLPPVCDDDGVEDGFHVFNLKDANNAIINGLPNGLIISYFETYEDALLEMNKLPLIYTNIIPYSQVIFARVENNNNCYGISEVNLTVNKLPNIESKALNYYCTNTFPKTITINAGLINDLPINYTYKWDSGEETYQIQINELGIHTVTVTNANGCSKTKKIIIEPSNIATINKIEIKDVTQNNSILVNVSGEGIYEYALFDEKNVLISPYQENNLFENVRPGFYIVSVRDIKNDCGMVSDYVSVIGYPKFFSPNNDGFNDTWQIYGVSSAVQPNTKIQIFDRFGKLLKEITPLSNGWDGTLNGEKLPTDDYWFSVKLQDGRIFKNHFSLKR